MPCVTKHKQKIYLFRFPSIRLYFFIILFADCFVVVVVVVSLSFQLSVVVDGITGRTGVTPMVRRGHRGKMKISIFVYISHYDNSKVARMNGTLYCLNRHAFWKDKSPKTMKMTTERAKISITRRYSHRMRLMFVGELHCRCTIACSRQIHSRKSNRRKNGEKKTNNNHFNT